MIGVENNSEVRKDSNQSELFLVIVGNAMKKQEKKDLDWTEMYYRDCVIENCTKSAHWETICVGCKKHVCDGHIGYNSRLCINCMEIQAIQAQKDRRKASQERQKEKYQIRSAERRREKLIDKIEKQSRKIRTRENKKLKKLAIKEKYREKLEAKKKSEIDIYFEISFFRKLNLHRIRRKKQ